MSFFTWIFIYIVIVLFDIGKQYEEKWDIRRCLIITTFFLFSFKSFEIVKLLHLGPRVVINRPGVAGAVLQTLS